MSSSSEEEVVKRRVTSKRTNATSTRRKKVVETESAATTEGDEVESVPKKVVTKRATKRVATAKPAKRTTRTKAKVTDTVVTLTDTEAVASLSVESDTKSLRKAPTNIEVTTSEKKRFPIAAVAVMGIALVLGGSGIWYGMSDPGQIDVETLVARHNERVARGEAEGATDAAVLPVQRPILRPVDDSSTSEGGDQTITDSVAGTATSTIIDDIATSTNDTNATTSDITTSLPATTTSTTNDEGVTEGDTSYLVPLHVAQRQPFGST